MTVTYAAAILACIASLLIGWYLARLQYLASQTPVDPRSGPAAFV